MKKFVFVLLIALPVWAGAQSDSTQGSDTLIENDGGGLLDTFGWRFPGFVSINFSQVALNNWAAGGRGTIAVLGTANLQANYVMPRTLWENTLNLNYGVVKFDGSGFEKNDDRLEGISNYNYHAFKDYYYTGLASFKTQFTPTYKDSVKVSEFMSPAYLQLALGLSYKKGGIITIFAAPVAAKFTFVRNQAMADSGAFGVTKAVLSEDYKVLVPGERIRSEYGAYFLLQLKYDLMKNVNLQTRLELFNNYSDPQKDNRKNIDVNWETMINMKVNSFISASIFTHLIYDQNTPINLNRPEDPSATGPRTQFKEVFGLGFSYKFR